MIIFLKVHIFLFIIIFFIKLPSYSWTVPKKSYTPLPNPTMTLQTRVRSLTIPQNNISTIDLAHMKEVDNLYTVFIY